MCDSGAYNASSFITATTGIFTEFFNVPFEEVLQDIIQRDYNDENRAEAPLRQAEDAIRLDTSLLDFEQSYNAVLDIAKSRMAE